MGTLRRVAAPDRCGGGLASKSLHQRFGRADVRSFLLGAGGSAFASLRASVSVSGSTSARRSAVPAPGGQVPGERAAHAADADAGEHGLQAAGLARLDAREQRVQPGVGRRVLERLPAEALPLLGGEGGGRCPRR